MIRSELIEKADRTIRGHGRDATRTSREVHNAICEEIEVDPEVAGKFIDHMTENLARFRPMDNESKSLIATALRHVFAVGVDVGRKAVQEDE